MQAKLARIDLTNIPAPTVTDPVPLETLINKACQQQAAGFNLVSTFVFGTDLMLVFQKP